MRSLIDSNDSHLMALSMVLLLIVGVLFLSAGWWFLRTNRRDRLAQAERQAEYTGVLARLTETLKADHEDNRLMVSNMQTLNDTVTANTKQLAAHSTKLDELVHTVNNMPEEFKKQLEPVFAMLNETLTNIANGKPLCPPRKRTLWDWLGL